MNKQEILERLDQIEDGIGCGTDFLQQGNGNLGKKKTLAISGSQQLALPAKGQTGGSKARVARDQANASKANKAAMAPKIAKAQAVAKGAKTAGEKAAAKAAVSRLKAQAR